MTEEVETPDGGRADPIRLVLEERARALAKPPIEATEEATTALVVISVGRERYGIEARHVEHVGPLPDITPIPSAPAPWIGLVNFRGSLCPVMELGRSCEVRDRPVRPGMLVVVSVAGNHIALVGEEVTAVSRVPNSSIMPPNAESLEVGPSILGITTDLLPIIDLESLTTRSGMSPESEVAGTRRITDAKETGKERR